MVLCVSVHLSVQLYIYPSQVGAPSKLQNIITQITLQLHHSLDTL